MKTSSILKASAAPFAIGLALAGAPAMAQDAAAAVDCTATPNDASCTTAATSAYDNNAIVVTGSIFRRTDTETPSPVTVLTEQVLEDRGLNTVADAVQRSPANNAGAITQGWNTGFNFASGANAPALRGLTVQSTLSIADGLRLAPYPLADDGQRNFVDLNTIPDAIVERIEILRDGASSTYGADAIAGVINVITKKEIQGLHIGGSAGISGRGDAGEQRIDVTWGHGDLANDGFNFYVSGEYQRQDALFARDRGYPFNTADWTDICGSSGSCMRNLNWNGYTPENGQFNGLISIPGVTLIRPGTAGATTGAGRFEFLNPAVGCGDYSRQPNIGTSGTAPLGGACEVDFVSQFIMLQPEIERKGLSGRVTVNVGDRAQVYAMVNYYDTKSHASFTPLGLNGTPTPPNNGAAAYNVMLPIYVCPTGVGTTTGTNTGCTAANGTLNPYNPYAASGRTAQAFLRNDKGRTVDTELALASWRPGCRRRLRRQLELLGQLHRFGSPPDPQSVELLHSAEHHGRSCTGSDRLLQLRQHSAVGVRLHRSAELHHFDFEAVAGSGHHREGAVPASRWAAAGRRWWFVSQRVDQRPQRQPGHGQPVR